VNLMYCNQTSESSDFMALYKSVFNILKTFKHLSNH